MMWFLKTCDQSHPGSIENSALEIASQRVNHPAHFGYELEIWRLIRVLLEAIVD